MGYSDSSKLGVPADYKLDGNVNNMNVYSNAVKTQVGITGKAEFWDNCYAPSGGNSRAFDHDDRPTSANCYGSMQIHSGKNTVFGFNGWSHSGHCGVTIGNNKGTHTDGTFLTNCNSYQDGISEIRTYIEKPKPINCAGAFGGFSTCTKTCGGGSKIRTYKITPLPSTAVLLALTPTGTSTPQNATPTSAPRKSTLRWKSTRPKSPSPRTRRKPSATRSPSSSVSSPKTSKSTSARSPTPSPAAASSPLASF